MTRNDYRRALILLRALQSGYGGHVRLERRTMRGSLLFTVTGLGEQAGEACAVLGARLPDGWKIVRLGQLQRGAGRQAGLHWAFDPRSIEGLPLESYQIVAVAWQSGEDCRVLLLGFINGTFSLQQRELEEAICANACAYPRDSAAQDGTERQAEASAAEPEQAGHAPGADAEGSPEERSMEAPAAADGGEHGDAEDAAMDAPPQGSALALLGLDPDRRWPESIEPLRELFAQQEPFAPFEEEGYVFVRADADGDCPQCAVGIRAQDGGPASVAYAIPGISAEQRPAGLEGYVWRDGWWVVFADADTGALLEQA